MKKYKITLIGYCSKTKSQDYEETLTTKPCTIDKLEELVRKELSKAENICWSVKPYPKGFIKRFEND